MSFVLKAGNMSDVLLRYDKEKVYTFIDCETLNLCLNFSHNLPWQISMIKVKGDECIDSKDFYVKWDTDLKISKEAARITKYSESKLQKLGLPPEEVFPTVDDWLQNCDYIVGHNVLGFDIYLIRGLYNLMGRDYKPLVKKVIDTNCIARGIKSGESHPAHEDFLEYQYRVMNKIMKGLRTGLGPLSKEYNIEHDYDKLHDALVDLQLNVKLWNKLKWQIEL